MTTKYAPNQTGNQNNFPGNKPQIGTIQEVEESDHEIYEKETLPLVNNRYKNEEMSKSEVFVDRKMYNYKKK